MTFLLAVMVLILSCLPCRDNDMAMAEGANIHLAVNDEHGKGAHQDLCPPFCTCSCCSVASVFHPAAIEAARPEAPALRYSDAYLGAVISISLPVWQPPQLLA